MFDFGEITPNSTNPPGLIPIMTPVATEGPPGLLPLQTSPAAVSHQHAHQPPLGSSPANVFHDPAPTRPPASGLDSNVLHHSSTANDVNFSHRPGGVAAEGYFNVPPNASADDILNQAYQLIAKMHPPQQQHRSNPPSHRATPISAPARSPSVIAPPCGAAEGAPMPQQIYPPGISIPNLPIPSGAAAGASSSHQPQASQSFFMGAGDPGDSGSSESSSRSNSRSPPRMPRHSHQCRVCGEDHEEHECPHLTMNAGYPQPPAIGYAANEEDVIRVKSLSDLTFPNPPDNAGQARGYVNQVLMAIGKLQKTPGSEVYQWAQQCLTHGDAQLKLDPRFPRTDREIASKLIKTCRKGKFGLVFQQMVESERYLSGDMPCGRVMLRYIFKHFQLERDRIGMLGERNLLSLRIAGNSVADLEAFRDKYIYVMSSIPIEDLPKEATLYNHLVDELERNSTIAPKVVKAREAMPGSHRKTTDWLWKKVELTIQLDQQCKSRAAFDQNLKLKPAQGLGLEVNANPAKPKKEKKQKKEKDKDTEKPEKKDKKEKKPKKERDKTPNPPAAPAAKA